MDKGLRGFISASAIMILLLGIVTIGFTYIYQYSSINTYEVLLFAVILTAIIFMIMFAVAAGAVLTAYRKKGITPLMARPLKTVVNILMPLIINASGIFGGQKNSLRKFFVDINNILTESSYEKYSPDEILVLLPHCLQNTGCSYKVAGNVENCRNCGKCCIGEIRSFTSKKGIRLEIVTGGTAARNVIVKLKPGLVISVACERDLISGIADVGKLHVLGIINERPNGPCKDTLVSVNLIKEKVESVLKNGY